MTEIGVETAKVSVSTSRRAIAYMMHHDLDTADKIYNKQTMDEKIALGVEFVNRANFDLTTCVSQLQPIGS